MVTSPKQDPDPTQQGWLLFVTVLVLKAKSKQAAPGQPASGQLPPAAYVAITFPPEAGQNLGDSSGMEGPSPSLPSANKGSTGGSTPVHEGGAHADPNDTIQTAIKKATRGRDLMYSSIAHQEPPPGRQGLTRSRRDGTTPTGGHLCYTREREEFGWATGFGGMGGFVGVGRGWGASAFGDCFWFPHRTDARMRSCLGGGPSRFSRPLGGWGRPLLVVFGRFILRTNPEDRDQPQPRWND